MDGDGGVRFGAPLSAAGVVLLLMNIAIVFPLWPGNVGLLQAAVALPLRDYGVPYATGFAFGLVLQAVEVSVGVGLGLVCLAREGLSFAVLRRMARRTRTPPRTWSRRFASSWRSSTRTRLPVRALLCPASLKGVLSARDAAAALARGVRASGGEAVELPVADGGEGTAEALERALGGEWQSEVVSDPLGRPVSAALARSCRTGARSSRRRPRSGFRCSRRTSGTRSSRRAAASASSCTPRCGPPPRRCVVGLGGSATVDGGAGLREVVRELPVPRRLLCDVRTMLADAARALRPSEGRDRRRRRECSSSGSRR